MSVISEKVAYIKGLADGLGLDESSSENKVLLQILDVLKDIADEIDYLEDENQMLSEYIDSVSDDLEGIEQELLVDDYDDDYDDYYPISYEDLDSEDEDEE